MHVCTVVNCTGEDTEVEPGVLTEKLGTSLMIDFERLKLGSVCNFMLCNFSSLFYFAAERRLHYGVSSGLCK